MAGITWWTGARLSALESEIEAGASYAEAARRLSRRFRRRVTAEAVAQAARRRGLHGQARGGRPRTRGES